MLRRSERGGPAASRRSNLQQLLRVAGNLQQQAATGDHIGLPTSEIGAAERIVKELKEKFIAQELVPLEDVDKLWSHPSQDTSNFLALFCLALRRSSPFAGGSGTPSAFASVRENLIVHFHTFRLDLVKWRECCCETMGPLLLRTDALGCYSRLLAEAAEQLQEAAAAALPAQALAFADSGASAGSSTVSAASRSEGQGVQRKGAQRQPSEPGVQAQRPRAQQVDLQAVESLLCEVISVMTVLCTGIQEPQDATVSSGSSSSSRPRSAGAAGELLHADARAQLQSTWVLEHWARVLLLATAPALAGGNSKQQKAQTLQTDFFQRLCALHSWMRLYLVDFVRRPWGCSLAFIYMARLCAALDGECEERYGLPRHSVLVLPAAAPVDSRSLVRVDQAAEQRDALAMQHGQAFSLLPALLTLKAWAMLLAEDLEGLRTESPAAAVAEAGVLAPGGASAGAGEGQGVCRGSTEQGQVGDQVGSSVNADEEGVQLAVEDAILRRLPPLNRTLTIDMCLRLARGLLANWGTVIPGVRVRAAGSGRVNDGGRMQEGSGSAVLQFALACARLALLPDVWGRARVRGRTRARLRAWWETYVAAAQHPEALLLTVFPWFTFPSWIAKGRGLCLQPSADSVAALEAGLLPCVTRLVIRMGSGNDGGAVWYPPDCLPGVGSCWPEVMLCGPLGQVAELASALGRRLRLAVEQLRSAVEAAAGGAGLLRRGRSCDWLAEVAHGALQFAWARMKNVLSGALHLMQRLQGPREAAVAGMAVRVSVMAAELLPAVSHGVLACAELARLVGLGGGQGQGRTGGEQESNLSRAVREVLREVLKGLTDGSLRYATCALDYAAVLLARHCLEAVEQRRDSGGGPAAAGGVDTPGRQLLLRDVRLMELLGAAVELHCTSQAQDHWPEMSASLAAVLPLAAAAFPAEFRAAAQGGGEGAAGGAKAGSTRGMAWAAPLRALGGVGLDSGRELEFVERVLRGWDPSPEEAWGTVRGAMVKSTRAPEETLLELLRNMLPPAEARAAAAEAAAPAAAPAAATAAAGAATAGG